MAKKTISGVNVGLVGESTVNFIKQISDGTTAHDLALTKTIKFFNGADGDAIEWDGTQAIEVVIPSVTDIIQDPVRMVGTVGSEGTLPSGLTPSKGDLLYITAPCAFQGVACEAGDMAIYDGSAWHVIQGENQVSLDGGTEDASGNHTVLISGSAVKVLDVEGRGLNLAIDYADVDGRLVLTSNTEVSNIPLEGATVSVAAMSLSLSQANGSALDISKAESITYGTELADGTVTFTDNKVLVSGDFDWSAGSLGTVVKNSDPVSATVSHNLSIGRVNESNGASGDYVTDVTAIQGVALVDGTALDKNITFVSGISADTSNAKSFVSGIHAWREADGAKAADFTIPGAVVAASADNTFVKGISSEGSDVVTGVTVGTVSITSGSGILTGIDANASGFVASVSFGSAVVDPTASWFFSGLTEESTTGEVVSSVDFGTVSLVSGDSNFAASAITAASVSEHVLTFNVGSFMTPVNVSVSGQSVGKKNFTSTGVSLTGFSSSSAGFTTGSLKQADSVISTGGFATSAVSLTAGATISYYLDTDKEHAYIADLSYQKFSYTSATISKNTPKLENPTSITATIAANTFMTDYSGATLPSLSISAPSGTLSASVGTTLETSTYSWAGIDVTKQNATEVPGAYSLVSVSEGGVVVAAASDYGVTDGTVTIKSGLFLTDVEISHS